MPKVHTTSWREIRAARSKLDAEQQTVIDEKVQAQLRLMHLPDLRRMRNVTQETLAEALNVEQSAVSKIERRTDLYVNTLRRFIEAAGGNLRIIAEFENTPPIEIALFSDIANDLLSKSFAKSDLRVQSSKRRGQIRSGIAVDTIVKSIAVTQSKVVCADTQDIPPAKRRRLRVSRKK
jgi:transcriptional regulator with XRE-family HTH domain